jgi:MFS family permease
MVIAWFVSCYGYYMMNFYMKYIPGNIYVNASTSAIAQLLGVASAGAICEVYGPKKTIIATFSMASIFGFLSLSMWYVPESIPYFVFFASFGIASSYHIGYLANQTMFKSSILGTCTAICNIAARVGGLLAPMTAELP